MVKTLFKVLMVEVSMAIDADKIPSNQMALAGDGTAQVATEVRSIKPKELTQLRQEAATAAIKQAVEKFITTFKSKKKSKKRRRRRR